MTERTVRSYDPPAAAIPDTARYTAAMTYRASREAKALAVRRWYLGAVVLSLAWGALMTWDNVRLAGTLAELARHKPVYRIDQALDGHQRLMLVDDRLTVTKGMRVNAVHWFVTWLRRIGTDPVTLARDRAAGRARLEGAAAAKWDALVEADLDPAEGWSRDVAELRIEEGASDPAAGTATFHVAWTETVYRHFRPVARHLMSASVLTLDGPPRDGALDGVGIAGFTAPSGTPLPLPGPPSSPPAPGASP
jgi:hypothetical protein